jgi:hypothetical protein
VKSKDKSGMIVLVLTHPQSRILVCGIANIISYFHRALASIAKDPESKSKFDEQMMKSAENLLNVIQNTWLKGADWWPIIAPEQVLHQWTFPECDVSADPDSIEPSETVNAFLFGRTPNYAPYNVTHIQHSWFFPRGMVTDVLFPSTSSVYTDPHTGILYESPCYTPNAEAVVESVVCPSPFLPPMTDEWRGNCIKPCPVQAYSEDEYHGMWIISSAPACVGLLFNIYMTLTWYNGGKQNFERVPFYLKMCVGCGMLYGFIDTVPVLVLGEELPWCVILRTNRVMPLSIMLFHQFV